MSKFDLIEGPVEHWKLARGPMLRSKSRFWTFHDTQLPPISYDKTSSKAVLFPLQYSTSTEFTLLLSLHNEKTRLELCFLKHI